MKNVRLILFLFVSVLCFHVKAQDDVVQWRTPSERDSMALQSQMAEVETSRPTAADGRYTKERQREIKPEIEELSLRDSIRLYRKPNAMRAVWMGAVIPGYGQIYNGSYWKLPIVYGAFVGCAYAITSTNALYQDYKIAYRDILTDKNPSEDPSKSYIAILPEGYTLDRVGGVSGWTNTLKGRQNNYRRYRDISIVATVLVYALSLIDAYVDAQLFDYDISPNLSMSVEQPSEMPFQQPQLGMQFAVHF